MSCVWKRGILKGGGAVIVLVLFVLLVVGTSFADKLASNDPYAGKYSVAEDKEIFITTLDPDSGSVTLHVLNPSDKKNFPYKDNGFTVRTIPLPWKATNYKKYPASIFLQGYSRSTIYADQSVFVLAGMNDSNRADISIAYFNKDGSIGSKIDFPYGPVSPSRPSMVTHDWNNDGEYDAVMVLVENDGIITYSDLSSLNSFEPTHNILGIEEKWCGYSPVATLADVDGDGMPEVAILIPQGNNKNYKIVVLKCETQFDTDSLDFDKILSEETQLHPLDRPFFYGITAGDYDNDGKDEIAIVSLQWENTLFNPTHVEIYKVTDNNHLKKIFGKRIDESCDVNEDEFVGMAVKSGDIDGDGNEEIIIANFYRDVVSGDLFVVSPQNSEVRHITMDLRNFHMFNMEVCDSAFGNITGEYTPTNPPYQKNALYVLLKFQSYDRLASKLGLVTCYFYNNSLHYVLADVTPDNFNPYTLATMTIGDVDDDSLLLGPPTHIVMDKMITPLVVMQEPPKHLDYTQDGDGKYKIINCTRMSFLYTEFEDKDTQESAVTTKQKTYSSFARTEKVGEKGGVNLKVFKFQEDVKAKFTQSWYKTSETYQKKLDETETGIKASTRTDDYVVFRCQEVDIWRYPIIGRQDDEGHQIFYQVVVPGPVETANVPGRNLEWYQPVHVNGILMSYPTDTSQIDDFNEDNLLTQETSFTLGGDKFTWDVSWTDEVKNGQKTIFKKKNKKDLDVSISLGGKIKKIFGVKVSGELRFKWDDSYTDTTINETDITKTSGFTIKVPVLNSEYSYEIHPFVYTTDTGLLKLSYVIKIPQDTLNNWWLPRYGVAPDPALALPKFWKWVRLNKETEEDEWEKNDAPDATQIRGMFFYDENGYPLGQVLYKDETKQVTIKCRVYNFAIYNTYADVTVKNLKVKFEYAKYDPVHQKETNRTTIGTVTIDEIPAFGDGKNWKFAEITWDISNVPDGLYKIHVTLDPDNEIKEVPKHDNGDEYSNNEGWFYVYVYTKPQTVGLYPGEDSLKELDGKLEFSSPKAMVGERLDVFADIQNTSDQSVVDVIVNFYDEKPDGTKVIFDQEYIPGIEPHSYHPVKVSLIPDEPGVHKIVMKILGSTNQYAVVEKDLIVMRESGGGCSLGFLESGWIGGIFLTLPIFLLMLRRHLL